MSRILETMVNTWYILRLLLKSELLNQIKYIAKQHRNQCARDLLCCFANRELEMGTVELFHRLHIGQPAMSRSVQRCEWISELRDLYSASMKACKHRCTATPKKLTHQMAQVKTQLLGSAWFCLGDFLLRNPSHYLVRDELQLIRQLFVLPREPHRHKVPHLNPTRGAAEASGHAFRKWYPLK